MGQNLTGQTIASTYEDLVQISGSILTDGLGNDITSLDITVSNATSASYAVNAGDAATAISASHALNADNAISSSYALTASFALNAGGADTGSLMVTGSVNLNTLTFTKGDGSTFDLTVNTGSGGGGTVDTGSLMVTGSVSLNTLTFTKGDGTTFDLTVDTGSAVTIDTGSLLVTASISDATTTYTKGDGSTFALVTNNVNNAVSASYATTADSATTATSASHALNADNAISSSYALTASYVEGGVNPFPFTGTASIDGALEVTGSVGGILTDGEDVIIYATQSANNLVPNILIGAQDPTINNLNFGIGYNNVVLGTGELKTDLKGLASGSGNSNAVLGGFAGYIGRGNYNTIAGGGKNTIASGSTLLNGQAATYNFMGGGNNNIIGERSINTAVVGGTNHEILPIGTNGSLSSGIFAGTNVVISGSDYAGALAARDSNIIFGNQAVIVGGDDHNIVYGSATTANSAIIAGQANTQSHIRSVVIGGNGLASTKDDEVVVPNLTISGSGAILTFADGTTQSTAAAGGTAFPFTGSAEILGNVNVTVSGSSDAYLITSGSLSGSAIDNISNITGSTQIKHIAYCSQAEYDAITPDDNTMYVIEGSGDVVENLIVSGSFEVSGSTIFTGSVVGNVGALSISSNTASLDLSTGNFFTLQLVSGSNTYINPSNIQAGQTINLLLSTTGSATVSFPSSVKQTSGSLYVPTTTTSKDIITFISFDATSLYLSNIKNLV